MIWFDGERLLEKPMYMASVVCPTLTVMVGCSAPHGQLVEHRVDLDVDFGGRLGGVVVLAQITP